MTIRVRREKDPSRDCDTTLVSQSLNVCTVHTMLRRPRELPIGGIGNSRGKVGDRS